LCTSDANCTDLPGSTGACVIEAACPTCINFGTGANHCWTGQNHGQACTPVGSKTTTLDCLPNKGDFIGPLSVTLAPLATGTSTKVAVADTSGVAPRNGQFFFCGPHNCVPTGLLGDPCQRTQGCFGRTTCKNISETGSPAGNLTDNAAHAVTIATTFCIPASGSGLVDGGTGADLGGPGAVSIRGTFQITP
jgi:hypothetical protein